MTTEKYINKRTEGLNTKNTPYIDIDRMSYLISRAEKMRAGSWKDFFRKN